MKIITLRARLPDARPTHLHERITVLAGLSAADREALRSTFGALTSRSSAGLEAVLRVHDTTIPLDDSFATTFGLLDAPSCVIEVPAKPGISGGGRSPDAAGSAGGPAEATGPGAQHANEASLARLRARREAVRSELTITSRALEEHPGESRPRLFAGAGTRQLRSAPSATMRELADQLGSTLGGHHAMGAPELADRLEALASRRVNLGAREAALAQLMSECRIAIDSVEDAITRGGVLGAPGSELLAQVEAVRDEMVQLAGGQMSRRVRKRLGDLRVRESELLATGGFASHAELLAAVRSSATDGVDEIAVASARVELLHELEAFWAQRREQATSDRREESELLALAVQMLGEPPGLQQNPRLVAAKLRSRQPGASQMTSGAKLLASRLAAEMGHDRADGLTPREVLEMAEAEIAAADSSEGLPGESSAIPGPDRQWATGPIASELQDREHELRVELEDIESRLAALERAVAVGAEGPRETAEPRMFQAEWSLTAELDARPSLPQVGGLPVLLMEPEAPTALDAMDVPSVVAQAARQQIVWVTDRQEVISGMEMLGNLGMTIIV